MSIFAFFVVRKVVNAVNRHALRHCFNTDCSYLGRFADRAGRAAAHGHARPQIPRGETGRDVRRAPSAIDAVPWPYGKALHPSAQFLGGNPDRFHVVLSHHSRLSALRPSEHPASTCYRRKEHAVRGGVGRRLMTNDKGRMTKTGNGYPLDSSRH